MIKFINAEWLKAFFEADKGKGRTTPIDSLLALIDDAPSIDIVRCKECRHRPVKEDAEGKDYGFNIIAPNEAERCPCLVDDGWYSWMPEDDFYCGYGEREGE